MITGSAWRSWLPRRMNGLMDLSSLGGSLTTCALLDMSAMEEYDGALAQVVFLQAF